VKNKKHAEVWPKKLAARLTKLRNTYSPGEGDSHFKPLVRGDANLYPALLELGREGLVWTRRGHLVRKLSSKGGGGWPFEYNYGFEFWYDLFLTASRAAILVRNDSAEAYIPRAVVRDLLGVLFDISRYALADGGDLTNRLYEAVGNTLQAFHDDPTIRFTQTRARRSGVASLRLFKWAKEKLQKDTASGATSRPSDTTASPKSSELIETSFLQDEPPKPGGPA
jgi:hypothetical protein